MAPLLFDTHCHLDAPEFDHDREDVWERAVDHGVVWGLVPAVEPSTWQKTLTSARTGHRHVALGVHPRYMPALTAAAIDDAMNALEATIRASGNAVVAVGECGFDGSDETLRAQSALQREVFCAHATVARSLDLPLVVHVLRAHGEAIAAMRATALPSQPGVIHSYSGNAALVPTYLAMGWHLAFGASVTRPNARRPIEALCAVPRARLLLETDAPDQTPTGVANTVRRCEPAHLAIIAERVAVLRGEALDDLATYTSKNAHTLFGLNAVYNLSVQP
jgi:TatD DNase family protein